MPFQIIHRNLAEFACDAIVNPTDEICSGGGGTDYAVHKAAGRELDDACAKLKTIRTGEVAVTEGYALPCRYVIHTVGPVWEGGHYDEVMLLRSCYLNALLQAKKLNLSSIAFPLISSGAFGFPKDRVLRIAIDAIADFLYTADSEMQVYLCILDRNSFVLSKEIALREYINQSKRFVYEDHALKMRRKRAPRPVEQESIPENSLCFRSEILPEEYTERISAPSEKTPVRAAAAPTPVPDDISVWIRQQDDTFAVMLLKLIDRKGMTTVECYKKANVSKGTFWKINNDPDYKPSKETIIAFAIALKLDMDETEALLRTVGFSLSNSNTFDRIIQFYILNRSYDIFEINAALYQYDQVCLGC